MLAKPVRDSTSQNRTPELPAVVTDGQGCKDVESGSQERGLAHTLGLRPGPISSACCLSLQVLCGLGRDRSPGLPPSDCLEFLRWGGL